jgi:hypothetical protein
MFTKAAIVSALSAFAVAYAEPTARNTSPIMFTAMSTHSGDENVDLRGINASGQRFYLNKATSIHCPDNVDHIDCSNCKLLHQSRFPSNSDTSQLETLRSSN